MQYAISICSNKEENDLVTSRTTIIMKDHIDEENDDEESLPLYFDKYYAKGISN
jgi:hypothetical protein